MYNSLSFRPTLAAIAIPRLNTEIKKNWLQLDLNQGVACLNPQPCSKLHVFNTRPIIQLHNIKFQPVYHTPPTFVAQVVNVVGSNP